jgi:hypothetical protein
MAMNKVKEECEGVAQKLISKLEMRFPKQEIMTTLGVVYPQYWVVDSITMEDTFFSHLSMLKMAFRNPHKIGGLDQNVSPLLSAHMLDLQSSHFKMTMLHNFETTLHKKNQLNPLTRLWCKISTFVVFNFNLSEYIKLAKIIVVQVIGLVEDEWTFNTIAFMKNKSRNRLSTHIDLCIRFHNHQLFALQNFPYD